MIAGTLHKKLPASEFKSAKIIHDSPDMLTRMRASIHGQPLRAKTYTRLLVGNQLWMTDAEFEVQTNQHIVRSMSGDILIAGLGIGLILDDIFSREVDSVTVLEISRDVISLVGPHYADKRLKIIRADAYKWKPTMKFDCIYFDIWPNIPNEDDAGDIKKLKVRYKPFLRRGGWMRAWCE